MVTSGDRHGRSKKQVSLVDGNAPVKEEYAGELAAIRDMPQIMGRVGRKWSIPASPERTEFAEEITRIRKKTNDQRNRQIPGDDIE